MSILCHTIDMNKSRGYHKYMSTLKELRLKSFISQADLAEKAGIATETINRLERGKRKPSFRTIHKLAEALGVEPGEINF